MDTNDSKSQNSKLKTEIKPALETDRLSFGMYNDGRTLLNVPGRYWRWFLAQDFARTARNYSVYLYACQRLGEPPQPMLPHKYGTGQPG